jgi:hypothetical protein
MERVPVEIWQQILLKVMEADDAPVFATTCTPYTFLYFVYQHTRIHKKHKPYHDYLERRRHLRLVCRAWNEFILTTSHRWLQLEDERDPVYELDPTLGNGAVHPVELLSTTIKYSSAAAELVTHILSWTSHILKRPANQSPLRAYTLRLYKTPTRNYNPFDDLVGPTTTTAEYTNTTLRVLSITAPLFTAANISLPQISSTFPGLRALFLLNVVAMPEQTITLPHLEFLCVQNRRSAFLTLSVRAWDTPALRHAHLGHISTPAQFAAVFAFLGRYAPQIESLFLSEFSESSTSFMGPHPGFWDAFSRLRLLGMKAVTLEREDWAGWTVVPPPTHPLRYLVCWSSAPAETTVDRVRQLWTYHEGVRLVARQQATDTYHIVNDVRDGQWIARMVETNGILPDL